MFTRPTDRNTRGSGPVREEASTFDTLIAPDPWLSRTGPLPPSVWSYPKFSPYTKPVGADLSAKRPVHSIHLLRMTHRLRGQVRSHQVCGLIQNFRRIQNPWERTCPRRGQYIRYTYCALPMAFADRSAPTKCVVLSKLFAVYKTRGSGPVREEASTFHTLISPDLLPSRTSPLPQRQLRAA